MQSRMDLRIDSSNKLQKGLELKYQKDNKKEFDSIKFRTKQIELISSTFLIAPGIATRYPKGASQSPTVIFLRMKNKTIALFSLNHHS